ncbi:MAG: hypothetical protein P4L22_07355 [Candidatus Babeliales bacterium]|nr:hypothetical protein [Candidatus Babeliales bacterium]
MKKLLFGLTLMFITCAYAAERDERQVSPSIWEQIKAKAMPYVDKYRPQIEEKIKSRLFQNNNTDNQ